MRSPTKRESGQALWVARCQIGEKSSSGGTCSTLTPQRDLVKGSPRPEPRTCKGRRNIHFIRFLFLVSCILSARIITSWKGIYVALSRLIPVGCRPQPSARFNAQCRYLYAPPRTGSQSVPIEKSDLRLFRPEPIVPPSLCGRFLSVECQSNGTKV